MMSSISSVRLPRSDLWTPTASYSASFQPTPAPRITRLSDRNWSVASSLARSTGLRSGMIRIDVPEADPLRRRPAATASADQRLEPVHRVEPLRREQVVGDEQRVEAELLHRPRERLDAARALGAVALPDVGGQEDPEPADVTHGRASSLLVRPQRPRYSGSRFVEEGGGALEHVVGGEDADRGLELGGEAGLEVGVAARRRSAASPRARRAGRASAISSAIASARGDAPRPAGTTSLTRPIRSASAARR